jgi:hypothetical protein
MKIQVPAELNPVEVVRRAGYGQVMDRRATEPSWARRLGSGIYPRFHIYIKGDIINLHLDQKQVSYDGYNAHSGEYDGETVETEGQRIASFMPQLLTEKNNSNSANQEPEKSGWFSRFFGA